VSWEYVKLGSLVELITKGTTPTSVGFNFVDNGINFIKIESIALNGKFIPSKFAKINSECNSSLKRSQLKAGDILFSIAGALGRTAIVTNDILPANTNQALAIIRLQDERIINKEFLVRVLASESIFNQVAEMKGGVAQQNLSLSQIKDFLIPLPPLSTQQKIVAKLDAVFAEIDKATAAAESNAKNAESLFQSYLRKVFENGGDDFVSKTIGEVCTLRSGTTVNSSLEKTEGELPYLKVADMNLIFNQDSITTSSRFLNKLDINKNSIIRKGSTIFPKRGGAIDTNKKRITDVDIAVDLNIMSVYPTEKLNPHLLYFFFLNLDMRKLGSGASIRQINNYDIEPLIINFPKSLSGQIKLINVLSNLKIKSENLISNYKFKKSELFLLRQSILAQAFNGELVKE
jgi:type I restriction enzyme, S subunit